MTYESKDNDVLDKLKRYPLLIAFPIPFNSQAGVSTSDSNGAQLSLEVSTSLATLGLADVDYERSFKSINGRGGRQEEDEEEVRVAPSKAPPRKDAFFGTIQKYPTVPGHLSAGDSITEVFGVADEK